MAVDLVKCPDCGKETLPADMGWYACQTCHDRVNEHRSQQMWIKRQCRHCNEPFYVERNSDPRMYCVYCSGGEV